MAQRAERATDVVVVGRSCRLPGAPSVDALWANLVAGRSSVTSVPDERWSKEKHGHPRQREPGKSYVWAAGVLDDIWSFDPGSFGLSPREAEQMDPQQRLLLELTWEALEDAGITRSSVAGTDVGVFVGASSTEYQTIRNADMPTGDAYTATGGALSIVSNRISHLFDLKGPSFTVDTACSSSLVALHQALEALRAGRIDTAIVGGVNLLLSPFGFVIFSQASMLSPGGLCRTFDAAADGYVRAEGGVVLVLQTAKRAERDGNRAYARLVASGVNSDGRTNGIALPSAFAQGRLLRDVYGEAGIRPADVAFVEAHGTGTRVGDPIEADTIGSVLGRERPEPLPVGSIKSNIGHLEPASGLAGVLKAMLALEHDLLPPTINFSEPNPDIPFGELNLAVADKPVPLPGRERTRYAGINSFGFGGTNAHVVIADPVPTPARPAKPAGESDLFVLSAATRNGVLDLARRYAERLSGASFAEAQAIAAAAAHRRELMAERAVVEWSSLRDLNRTLERIADKDEVGSVTWGTVTEPKAPVAFVFSGNGGQHPGMGQAAYRSSRHFRESFDEIDSIFDADFGWSITEALFAADLEQRLPFTHVAQPLIFAIQVAAARALEAEGLRPAVVLGHSVGEIAAATVAGALTLRDAVRVIHARSAHQELARDAGRMAVLVGSRETIEGLAAEIGGIEIAAFNSPRTFTVAGPTEAIAALGSLARKRRTVFRKLDLDYPFHCGLIDPVREPLLRDLRGLKVRAPALPMISTVTGEAVEGPVLDAEYWWRNVREPVRFSAALDVAARQGARIFMELGPRSVLLSNVTETLEPTSLPVAAFGVLDRSDDRDPIRPAVISAFVRGADIPVEELFGPAPSGPVPLPTYPWQRKDVRSALSPEAVASTLDTRWHRLAGARHTADATEWHGQLDTTALPELADHEVGGQPILPGSAFVEIALTVARQWFGCENAAILELDIFQPLVLEADRAKEIKARLSPATNMLEILSRPRLSRTGWHLHAVARLTDASEPASAPPVLPADATGRDADASGIYRAAEAVGLRYGPAFRLLRSVGRRGPDGLAVELAPSTLPGSYTLDPASLDACFHGLFTLFGELAASDRGTAYIPVRFGHVRVEKAGAAIRRCAITLRQAGEGSIVADFVLLDEAGAVAASLQDARFQAARVRRTGTLEERGLVLRSVPADRGSLGEPGLALPAPVDAIAAELGLAADAEEADSAEQILLEGWAASAGFEIARRASTDGFLAEAFLAEQERPFGPWLAALLRNLEASGLAEPAAGGWRLAEESGLPPSGAVLGAIAAEQPHRSAELLLAAGLGEAGSGSALPREPSGAAVDGFELGGASARASAETVSRLLDRVGIGPGPRGALRILQVGYGPLSTALVARAAETGARLTLLEGDRRRLERARIALAGRGDTAFAEGTDELPAAGYDLVVSAEGLSQVGRGPALDGIAAALAPGGVLIAVEPQPSAFRDLTLGLRDGWFEDGAGAGPAGPLRSASEWEARLAGAGFEEVASGRITTGRDVALLLSARAAADRPQTRPAPRSLVLVPCGRKGADLGESLRQALEGDGHDLRFAAAETGIGPGEDVLFLADTARVRSDLDSLETACLALKGCAERLAEKSELWVLVRPETGGPADADPVAAGLAAFARTLANEMAGLTVRRVLIDGSLPDEEVARQVRTLLAARGDETDLAVGPDGPRALRVSPLADAPRLAVPAPDRAAALERGTAGGFSGLLWREAEAAAPAPGEVAIAVEATGLNFRDVMWAMSLLPDDILEDGYAGPTLGLECAGRVTGVGAGVTRFRPGDRVLSFAPSAFRTTVSVPEAVVAPIPSEWDTEAAASVPVAFLTAYYGLVTLAGLKRGEWVLIHGAAGGVGLAAVQIAQWRGATVVATAGSPEKRALLRALGVEHVLNSRSTAFVDDIRRLRPKGVDVVLNSLSGEAMERGLSTLRAFGRFVELGKRDYVANTRIGLRPFRRNLSYFGVDVDQLLSDGDRASAIFGEVMELFATGDLHPLPYRVFPAAETVDAFRLMQQSGHVGKILLRPPSGPVVSRKPAPFRFDPERTHLVTGGFGGFGLETARWLADEGVRHLVLVGRSGPQGPDAEALLAELAERGVTVLARSCDVADEAALAALLDEVGRSMPPLAGIIHAAMVLEDGLVSGLTAEQLRTVLAPKVAGADLLDRLTGDDPLDYFVLFSSITTVIGNPGQGAYVAANGYLEGLARRRRAAGRPGLALAWGAISDVGVLARSKGLAEALSKRVGVKAMPAREALGYMAQALAEPGDDPARAVLAVGSLDWGAARRLPALASPTFAALTRDGSVADAAERRGIDLRALVASEGGEAVRKQVVDAIVDEIATVLRIPRSDVSGTKRLAEMGLDSLMAIELASALQDRFELDAPPTGSVGTLTPGSLADHLIAFVSSGAPGEEIRVTQTLNERHAGIDMAAETLAPVLQKVTERAESLKGLMH